MNATNTFAADAATLVVTPHRPDASTVASPTPQALRFQGWKCHDALDGHMGQTGPLWSRRMPQGPSQYGVLIEAKHLNAVGVAHGGMLVTLADQAISAAAWHACGKQSCLTLQLDTHFAAAVPLGGFVQAAVDITHQTRSMVFARAVLSVAMQPETDCAADADTEKGPQGAHGEAGRLQTVLVAQGILKVLRAPQSSTQSSTQTGGTHGGQ